MTKYDPQRSRSRPRAADEGPAAVDALLTPAVGGNGKEAPAGARAPVVVDLGAPARAELPDVTGRRRMFRLAVLVALIATIVALVAARRRRSRGGRAPNPG